MTVLNLVQRIVSVAFHTDLNSQAFLFAIMTGAFIALANVPHTNKLNQALLGFSGLVCFIFTVVMAVWAVFVGLLVLLGVFFLDAVLMAASTFLFLLSCGAYVTAPRSTTEG